MLARSPTVQEVIHHDWTRKSFHHLPEDPSLHEHLDRPYLYPGTMLQRLSESPSGFEDALLVARDPSPRTGSRRLHIWHGAQRIQEETFYGLFGHRFQRISSAAFGLILQRASHFLILDASTKPTFLFPLAQFARFGVSTRVLEEVLDAPVEVAAESLYARGGHVPSLRVYASYDGNRYGESTRKLFYNQQGNPVPVELVAREVLRRFGYEVLPPTIFARLLFAVTGRPPNQFQPDHWPGAFLQSRQGPLHAAALALQRIQLLRDAGLFPGLVQALEAQRARPPYRSLPTGGASLPLISRYLTRSRFELFLESVGEDRLVSILEGYLQGYHAVSADWFAYMEGSRRVFPCEVKARGDHLRPYQKESILFCQRNQILDYRLLELLHNRPQDELNLLAA